MWAHPPLRLAQAHKRAEDLTRCPHDFQGSVKNGSSISPYMARSRVPLSSMDQRSGSPALAYGGDPLDQPVRLEVYTSHIALHKGRALQRLKTAPGKLIPEVNIPLAFLVPLARWTYNILVPPLPGYGRDEIAMGAERCSVFSIRRLAFSKMNRERSSSKPERNLITGSLYNVSPYWPIQKACQAPQTTLLRLRTGPLPMLSMSKLQSAQHRNENERENMSLPTNSHIRIAAGCRKERTRRDCECGLQMLSQSHDPSRSQVASRTPVKIGMVTEMRMPYALVLQEKQDTEAQLGNTWVQTKKAFYLRYSNHIAMKIQDNKPLGIAEGGARTHDLEVSFSGCENPDKSHTLYRLSYPGNEAVVEGGEFSSVYDSSNTARIWASITAWGPDSSPPQSALAQQVMVPGQPAFHPRQGVNSKGEESCRQVESCRFGLKTDGL
ncbi:uncharacterized protein MYCFIDRAFT_178129 [Pseudocercospora fijiensis CIRAD86]|uniref:Uncharacterized protein n=1 Tax=Pseudocercospora fijiensis (strain CIRAD86) TaxID=383855 RepID=M3A4K7_PSEFD|nr:uncharacterized protein MYCFIDRAFT_178129 [Pseudocercospora fijiensis CIRAD86]EME79541.1 hypothetical protein MYCFIDRAFT_178129 [Pseudocercospora fijiensis CIRAD86]